MHINSEQRSKGPRQMAERGPAVGLQFGYIKIRSQLQQNCKFLLNTHPHTSYTHIHIQAHWFCTFISLSSFSNHSLSIQQGLWYFHCIIPMLRGKGFYPHLCQCFKGKPHSLKTIAVGQSQLKLENFKYNVIFRNTKLEPLV